MVDVLGIGLPIVQAPMAGVQASALTIAVCEAGGLGSLPCALLTEDALAAELSAIGAQTGKPFNVNFFCHTPPVPDEAREQAWRDRLAPYYRELAVDPRVIAAGIGRMTFDRAAAEILAAAKPAFVSFHFGLPDPELLRYLRATGARVLSSATTVEEARWLESQGADAIIAQGLEAGGHRGMFLDSDVTTQAGTFALLPQIVNAVRVPVIAAGGIADARGVRAALTLGAAAVQVGTAYLLCPEAATSPVHRAALASDRARHTALTNVFTGRPARAIVNRAIRELGPMSAEAPAFPLAASAMLPLRAAAEQQGRDDFSALWCGQNATGCRPTPAGDLTRQLAGLAAG